ncbi:MAG: flavodoxin family protein [Candidatus Aminicenantes bacterium]
MKILIIYDSMYGNTEKIARAMGDAIPENIKVIRADKAGPSEVESIDLLIVGSPTQGFRATKPVQTFIEKIHKSSLKGMKVAAFDTRMPEAEVGKGLRFIMRMGGYAAPRIAKAFKKMGGSLVVPPEGFFVKDKEGPLKEGELERAAAWAKKVRKA